MLTPEDRYVRSINGICRCTLLILFFSFQLHGPTPLTAAARNYHGDVVRLLIENGDDVTEEELVR